MEIREGITIVVMKTNGKLGLVTGKHRDKWEVSTGMDSYTLYDGGPQGFVPILQLHKKADLSLNTPDEIIENHKNGIMYALRRKVANLARKVFELEVECDSLRRFAPPGY